MQDMEWCQQYAFHNRKYMLDLLATAVEKVTKCTPEIDRTVNRYPSAVKESRVYSKQSRTAISLSFAVWLASLQLQNAVLTTLLLFVF